MLKTPYNLLIRLTVSRMDPLSRLLKLYPMRTALDIHCQVAAPWVLDYPPSAPGSAPYHMLVNGSAFLVAAGANEVELKTGDVVVFPRGSAHRLHVGDADAAAPLRALDSPSLLQVYGNGGAGVPTDMLCGQFHFQDGPSNALLAALPDLVVVHTAGRPDCAGLVALIGMLKVEAEAARPGSGAVVAQLSSALFALLIRAWLEQAASMPGLFALLAERRLQPALQGMLEAPGQAWSLESLAEASHMSRATFARLFQKAAGATPATVLMQTRMAHAAYSLANSGRAVADIGEAVGYQSEAAFNRVFKRCFGIGPGQYRRDAKAVPA